MTVIEIAKRFDLQPKEVTEYIQANATFPVKRNYQTGEITIPDDVDIQSFFAPLVSKVHAAKIERERQITQQQREAAERAIQQQREAAERAIQQQREAAERAIQQQRQLEEFRFLQEDLKRKQTEQQHSVSIEKLKREGAEGYYQYKVISLMDENAGYINVQTLTANLNALGIEGWHLVTAYTNEIGHTSQTSGFGGISSGTNATVDQSILIFERFVKF